MKQYWITGILLFGLTGCAVFASSDSTAELPVQLTTTSSKAATQDAAPATTPDPTETPFPEPTSTASASTMMHADLPDLGSAPELTNTVWLNTDQPLRLAELQGQVIAIEMWTYG
jgi:hypothetical protein